ncbi:Multi-copper polyphenol oxidoreductase, laccase [Thermoanaerobacterium xylanolyticum LX-11]|uniref:Purine nucleoside phosphorylase n=1 Tax=Thermoanaerobacterium xylanolyticum (strain ATCC 49914 / DSM 7097 / LX-11) TaxID=858215 RepID=F6BKT6_THEXL|nr:peptidoglycan editing factor PgeF [Thermoanaerobacterium xylanolyticum]AEF18169.1 Multi-copper polyphenol oxidoreductase, laccase [Thermoanaerobacterium xylanolyticum LX-11]
MNRGFKRNEIDGVVFYTIPEFENTGKVKHLFSTRIGGVSGGPYSSLNLSLTRYDDRESVYENFSRICHVANINYSDMVFSNQVHSDGIRIVNRSDKGKNFGISDIKNADALMTNERGIPIVTFYADCTPLYFLDPVKNIIALAHAGWRGTAKEIGPKTVETMVTAFGSHKKDILAAIGPAIGVCCYEVGKDVADKISKLNINIGDVLLDKGDGKWMLNLEMTNYYELINCGIKDENITLSGLCTSCNAYEFYSYRRDKGATGSMAAFMELI